MNPAMILNHGSRLRARSHLLQQYLRDRCGTVMALVWLLYLLWVSMAPPPSPPQEKEKMKKKRRKKKEDVMCDYCSICDGDSSLLLSAAPKRKRPRLVKVDDQSHADATAQAVHPSSSISSMCKTIDGDDTRVQAQSPRSLKNTEPVQSENDAPSLVQVGGKPGNIQDESMRSEISSASDVKPPATDLDSHNRVERKEIKLPVKEPASDESIANCTESVVKL